MSERIRVAIAGARGAGGVELLRLLEERKFASCVLRLQASARSTRDHLEHRDYPHTELQHPYSPKLLTHNPKIEPPAGYNEAATNMVHDTKKNQGDAANLKSDTHKQMAEMQTHTQKQTSEIETP